MGKQGRAENCCKPTRGEPTPPTPPSYPHDVVGKSHERLEDYVRPAPQRERSCLQASQVTGVSKDWTPIGYLWRHEPKGKKALPYALRVS